MAHLALSNVRMIQMSEIPLSFQTFESTDIPLKLVTKKQDGAGQFETAGPACLEELGVDSQRFHYAVNQFFLSSLMQ